MYNIEPEKINAYINDVFLLFKERITKFPCDLEIVWGYSCNRKEKHIFGENSFGKVYIYVLEFMHDISIQDEWDLFIRLATVVIHELSHNDLFTDNDCYISMDKYEYYIEHTVEYNVCSYCSLYKEEIDELIIKYLGEAPEWQTIIPKEKYKFIPINSKTYLMQALQFLRVPLDLHMVLYNMIVNEHGYIEVTVQDSIGRKDSMYLLYNGAMSNVNTIYKLIQLIYSYINFIPTTSFNITKDGDYFVEIFIELSNDAEKDICILKE